ncbi:MAG: hypothetical protein M0036_26445 [Desulfobacteraceae bacterium]|nr:hypothetical protein [Desulfobacteraceae bacterium]
MPNQRANKFRRPGTFLFFFAVTLPVLWALAGTEEHPGQAKHHVFVAFGFHVNLYHSFRNDTNDESGFGKDIRVIRHIIRTLDRCNASGIPVKGVWDFDNLFSLQEILPQYAPDIIADIRRRIEENGDEVILMSYNNGLVSAMTAQELDDAVRWSITNPWQSGVQDVFGKYSPIVRPQEMMTTPGSFSIYKKHGVQAMALYYSATPFDAFRVFSRPLTRAEAHNPILYQNSQTKEQMVIIPTYHIGDLVEHVSLKHWVSELRNLQDRGELDRDALIFINYDADSELWSGLDLPWLMEWLPNTKGIGALVREVQDLPYVHFTTLGDYLSGHPAVGTVTFGQDTADGSFDGYNSWAEKADSSRYWTMIERNRRAREAALKAKSILAEYVDTDRLGNLINFADITRLRTLSTTHFGMATPYVARQRVQAMARLMEDLNRYSETTEQLLADGLRRYLQQAPSAAELPNGFQPLDWVMVLGGNSSGQGYRFLKIPRPEAYREGMDLFLLQPGQRPWPAVTLPALSAPNQAPQLLLFMDQDDPPIDGLYRLCAADPAVQALYSPKAAGDLRADPQSITNTHLAIRFGKDQIEGIYLDGQRQTESGSFTPYLRWAGQSYPARPLLKLDKAPHGGHYASLRMTGPFPGPWDHTQSDGWVDYRFVLMEQLPYVIVQGTVHYPTTATPDVLKAGTAGLIRRTDLNWQEVAPVEIRFAPATAKKDPVRVFKQNYLNVDSAYELDYFRCGPQNLNLDAVNNHITSSYAGVTAGDQTMAIAMDTSVWANFAFAPLKLKYANQEGTFSVRANPFGTYYGRQYHHPTWGNGNGFDVTLLTGEQYASSGPTYNGMAQTFSLMLAFARSRQLPAPIERVLVNFARPPLTISLSQALRNLPAADPLKPPKGLVAAYQGRGAVQFSWDNSDNSQAHYRVLCGLRPGRYDAAYPATGNSVIVPYYLGHQAFVEGKPYYATIEMVSAGDHLSRPASEIQFTIGKVKEKRPSVPLKLALKVLWANLHAMVSNWWWG